MSALVDNSGLRPRQEPLGTLLVERGLITPEQLTVALAEQKTAGKPIGAVVVALGFATPASVAQALATQHGGVLKTEYGFATGFGAGARPPELVSEPPVSAPRITKSSAALRVDPRSATPQAAEVDREAVRSELALASQETERLGDANGRLAEARAELEQRLATERQRVSSLEAAVVARDGQITELTEGAVAWQKAYAELERKLASTSSPELEQRLAAANEQLQHAETARAGLDERLLQAGERAAQLEAQLAAAAEELRVSKLATERMRHELESRAAELTERNRELEHSRGILASGRDAAKKLLLFLEGSGDSELVEPDGKPLGPSPTVGERPVAPVAPTAPAAERPYGSLAD